MKNRERLIQIRVSDDEHKTISEQAEKANMQIAPYVRMIAQNPTFVQFDYSLVSEHTKELAEIRNAINRIAFTIEATNHPLPRDMETVVNLMTEVFQTENKLLEKFREIRDALR